MTYVIAEPCVNVLDQSCVAVCPVDCIHFEEGIDRMLYIDPVECIDCGACEPECPVNAIFAEDSLPPDDLARSSVLSGEAMIADGLRRRLDAWSERSSLTDFGPTLIHGDATTTNFVFPSAADVVAIDWERLALGDPADDLGRLAPEVAAGIRSHGGPAEEAEAAVGRILTAYAAAAGAGRVDEPFAERFRFHRASSTLRIARNGWLPQTDRLRLVAQASALLA